FLDWRLEMKRIVLMGLLLLASASVSALEVAGVKLDDKAQVGAQSLVLNGAGIRTKYFFKVYVGALYLPQKQVSADAIVADEHEHRVVLHMLRELSSEKLFGAFNEAIKANHTAAELAALDGQLKQMAQIFEAVEEVKPGDVITLDYLPVSGTQISVNGTKRGTIAGAAFNRALLRIWLGSKPVQDDLKKALLGG
ncbi:MAG: chalcone isomerase family protein, partial [Gallionella sp.]